MQVARITYLHSNISHLYIAQHKSKVLFTTDKTSEPLPGIRYRKWHKEVYKKHGQSFTLTENWQLSTYVYVTHTEHCNCGKMSVTLLTYSQMPKKWTTCHNCH